MLRQRVNVIEAICLDTQLDEDINLSIYSRWHHNLYEHYGGVYIKETYLFPEEHAMIEQVQKIHEERDTLYRKTGIKTGLKTGLRLVCMHQGH